MRRSERSRARNASTTAGSNCRPDCCSSSRPGGGPAHRAAVRPVAGHRVERVGDREDPRRGRDLAAAPPVRIAAAVPALVMRADDLEPRAAQERDAAQELLAEHGVRLHQPALGRGQRPGLLQDPVRDPDLADVVEHEAVGDAFVLADLGCGDLRELDRVAAHALRVLAGPVILRLERAGERGHRLVVGVLEQPPVAALELEQVAEIAGVEQQLLVRLSLAGGPERGRVQPGRHALDHRQQLERAERLQAAARRLRPPARPPRRSRRSRSAARSECCGSPARFSAASTAPSRRGRAWPRPSRSRQGARRRSAPGRRLRLRLRRLRRRQPRTSFAAARGTRRRHRPARGAEPTSFGVCG